MASIHTNVLSDDELHYLNNHPEVIKSKSALDSQSSQMIYFSVPITNEIRDTLQLRLGLHLPVDLPIPMRWIKGDIEQHVDVGSTNFENTYLVYLNDSPGELIVDSQSYPIQSNTGFVFNEGLTHKTQNTENAYRLMIGPLNELIEPVGAPSIPYYTYITDVSNYDEGDSSYTEQNPDDAAFTVTLTNPFVFDGIPYTSVTINSNGYIDFNGVRLKIMNADLNSPVPYFIRYKEFADTFVVIYNSIYYRSDPPLQIQVKITCYLANNIRSGDVIADFGNMDNSATTTVFAITCSSGTLSTVNFLDYTFNSPYVFNPPNSPTQGTTGIQSTYANKQLVITTIFPEPPPYPCFKEDTKILTDKGYIPIQELRKGDMVKTLKHDFLRIDMIGKRDICHPAINDRIKAQLYQCSPDKYPEIFEPLIITGCHSILVENSTTVVNAEQIEKVKEVNGDIYFTDDKLRLPACADPRASVYEIVGTYTIYHLALENGDCYMNYGIYANGLLVETCSKRYLSELSNMDLIE